MKHRELIGLSIEQWKERNKAQKRRERIAGLFLLLPSLAAFIYTFTKTI